MNEITRSLLCDTHVLLVVSRTVAVFFFETCAVRERARVEPERSLAVLRFVRCVRAGRFLDAVFFFLAGIEGHCCRVGLRMQ